MWWRTWRKHRAWYDTPLMKANDLSGPALIVVARHFSNPQFAWAPANDREIWRW